MRGDSVAVGQRAQPMLGQLTRRKRLTNAGALQSIVTDLETSMKSHSLFATLALLVMSASGAEAAEWEFIGTQQANFKGDRDVIKVRGHEGHRAIKICVEMAPLKMLDLDVVYGNGERQDIQVRSQFEPGSCTRVIDLKGKRRDIDKITMVYNRVRGQDPAVVFVYAMR